jgi:hypothetical protein
MQIHRTIVDILQASSIILVFLTVIFGVKYPLIISDLETEIPNENKKNERNRVKKKLSQNFIMNCLPLTLLCAVFGYILLPFAFVIIKSSNIAIWNFDVLKTIFVIIVLWIWIMFFWFLLLAGKSIRKIMSIK